MENFDVQEAKSSRFLNPGGFFFCEKKGQIHTLLGSCIAIANFINPIKYFISFRSNRPPLSNLNGIWFLSASFSNIVPDMFFLNNINMSE